MICDRLSFQPRVLFLDEALIQLLEERRRLAQRLPRRQFALRPGADGPAVVVGQGVVAAGFFLVFDDVLGAEELPVVAQVLAPQASFCAVCGTLRVGARIVFRLSTARTLRVT